MALANQLDVRETISEVMGFAVPLIGSQDAALRWLGTPVRALNYATPISLLGQPEGKDAVLTVLHRAEHGIF